MAEVRIYKGSVLVDPECWVVDALGDVEAEARLIAAAPALLEALIEVQQMIEVGENNEGTHALVRDVIARAIGIYRID